MIKVYFGFDKDAIIDIDTFFIHSYSPDWFDDPVIREMIKDIDGSEVTSSSCIVSPVLGAIPPSKLSGGVKALICLYKLDDVLIDLVVCGENCCKWLSYILQHKDIRVTMSGYDLTFTKVPGEFYPVIGICENDEEDIKNASDWVDKMCDYAGNPDCIRESSSESEEDGKTNLFEN